MENKHALIITAYQELNYLEELCKTYSLYFKCYIHIDKKCKKSKEILERLNNMNNVFAISLYSINWGSYKHILAILRLLQEAVNDGIDFYHIISANTILIKNPQKLFDFFEKNRKKIYMEVKENRDELFYEFDYRYSAYFFQHLYNLRGKRKEFWGRVEKVSSTIQRKLKLRTNVKMNYKGYIYCHLNNEVVQYVLNYVKNNSKYIRTIKYCFVGEEFFFQNIIMKSEYASEVINNVLIYDEWGERGHPAFLDMTDLENLNNTPAFFARKVSQNQKELFDIIRIKEGF